MSTMIYEFFQAYKTKNLAFTQNYIIFWIESLAIMPRNSEFFFHLDIEKVKVEILKSFKSLSELKENSSFFGVFMKPICILLKWMNLEKILDQNSKSIISNLAHKLTIHKLKKNRGFKEILFFFSLWQDYSPSKEESLKHFLVSILRNNSLYGVEIIDKYIEESNFSKISEAMKFESLVAFTAAFKLGAQEVTKDNNQLLKVFMKSLLEILGVFDSENNINSTLNRRYFWHLQQNLSEETSSSSFLYYYSKYFFSFDIDEETKNLFYDYVKPFFNAGEFFKEYLRSKEDKILKLAFFSLSLQASLPSQSLAFTREIGNLVPEFYLKHEREDIFGVCERRLKKIFRKVNNITTLKFGINHFTNQLMQSLVHSEGKSLPLTKMMRFLFSLCVEILKVMKAEAIIVKTNCYHLGIFVILHHDNIEKELIEDFLLNIPILSSPSSQEFGNPIIQSDFLSRSKIVDTYKRRLKHILRDKYSVIRPY